MLASKTAKKMPSNVESWILASVGGLPNESVSRVIIVRRLPFRLDRHSHCLLSLSNDFGRVGIAVIGSVSGTR
jgi:hypothetical protein